MELREEIEEKSQHHVRDKEQIIRYPKGSNKNLIKAIE